jgi:hypothetical protein
MDLGAVGYLADSDILFCSCCVGGAKSRVSWLWHDVIGIALQPGIFVGVAVRPVQTPRVLGGSGWQDPHKYRGSFGLDPCRASTTTSRSQPRAHQTDQRPGTSNYSFLYAPADSTWCQPASQGTRITRVALFSVNKHHPLPKQQTQIWYPPQFCRGHHDEVRKSWLVAGTEPCWPRQRLQVWMPKVSGSLNRAHQQIARSTLQRTSAPSQPPSSHILRQRRRHDSPFSYHNNLCLSG